MSRILLDTNVLLSFLTDRSPAQGARAEALLRAAAAGETDLVLTQSVLLEFVFVLLNLYRRPVLEARELLRELLAMPGVETVDAVAWDRVLELWPAKVSDFADAVLAAVAVEMRIEAVATFDRGFARQLRRLEIRTPLAR